MHALAAPFFTSLLLLPLPDIIPDGMRGFRLEARIDTRALANDHCLAHVVQKGDTLTAIAKQWLGDERKWEAIQKLNPGITPERLQPGEVLWLPPKDPAAAAKEPVFVFVDLLRPFAHRATPAVSEGPIDAGRYWELAFYVVPAAHRAAFQKALTDSPQALQALADAAKVTVLTVKTPGRLVPTDSPVQRRVDTFVVEKDKDGKVAVRVHSVAFDKDGKQLETTTGQPAARDKAKDALLLLLAAAGGGLLLYRSRARSVPALA